MFYGYLIAFIKKKNILKIQPNFNRTRNITFLKKILLVNLSYRENTSSGSDRHREKQDSR